MNLTRIERETLIKFNEAEKTASVYTFNTDLDSLSKVVFCAMRPYIDETINRWENG